MSIAIGTSNLEKNSLSQVVKTLVKHSCKFIFFLTILLIFTVSSQGKSSPVILQELSDATARIVRDVTPAVVGIWVDINANSEQMSMNQPLDENQNNSQMTHVAALMNDNNSSGDQQSQIPSPGQLPQLQGHEEALGSGFIVSPDGYIITNNHVVGNADLVLVTVGNKEPVKAQVIGTDPPTDLAVIKISGFDNLPSLKFGDSNSLRVGDWVLAIGQPFGLTHTVTSGIISALGRSNLDLSTYEDFIQTDASINPGNSGGPLVNLNGQVVGVNSAILGSQGNIGIGFAIPAKIATYVYEQIRKNGKVIRGFIGVDIQELTPGLIAGFGLPESTKGALISHVSENSPAASAGLEQGDIIVEFNGKPVENLAQFQLQVSMLNPGANVQLVVLRKGERKTLTIELGMRIRRPAIASTPQPTLEVAGMAIQELTKTLADKLGYTNQKGLVVVAVAQDSISGFSGMLPGMLITQVNQQPVQSLTQFENALREVSQNRPILFLIYNKGVYNYLVLAAPGQ